VTSVSERVCREIPATGDYEVDALHRTWEWSGVEGQDTCRPSVVNCTTVTFHAQTASCFTEHDALVTACFFMFFKCYLSTQTTNMWTTSIGPSK